MQIQRIEIFKAQYVAHICTYVNIYSNHVNSEYNFLRNNENMIARFTRDYAQSARMVKKEHFH